MSETTVLAGRRLVHGVDMPPPVHTLRDVVHAALVQLNNAENNAAVIEGKLYGFACEPAAPPNNPKAVEEPPIEVLLMQVRDRLVALACKTEGILARLCLAFLCVLAMSACTPTTYTKTTSHADGSVSIYEVDYQKDWWSIIDEPDLMGMKGERRKIILPDGTVQKVNDARCEHLPVKPQVLYCQAQ